MPSAVPRAVIGFVAAAISVLTFEQAMWGALHVLALPGLAFPAPYPLDPLIPFGLPRIANECLLGGMAGALFALVSPLLRGPLWLSGLVLGAIIAGLGLVAVAGIKHFLPGARWIPLRYYSEIMTIVLTYGLPQSGGIASPLTWLRALLVDGAWGIGLGLILPWRGGRKTAAAKPSLGAAR